MAVDPLPTHPPPADRAPGPAGPLAVEVPPVAAAAGPDVVVDARSDPPPVTARAVEVTPETRMLPPHRNKLERVGDHVAAISADLRQWTEVRIALVKREIEDKVQRVVDAAKLAVPGLVLLAVGLLFLLLTIALLLGELLESYGLGFLIVTVVLLVAAGVLLWLAKRKWDGAAPDAPDRRIDVEPRDGPGPRAQATEAQRRRVQQAAA